ncbi:restriction endonuclease subunit S [Zobellella denitrificans]
MNIYRVQLKHIATISAGYPFRGRVPEVAGARVLAVQMKDVSLAGGIDWAGCIGTELTGKRQPCWLQPGDILVAARGSHNYAVPVGSDLQAGRQAVAAPHFFVVSINTEGVLPEYLAWLLNQAPCRRYFEQNAEGSLTKSIRRQVLEATPIALPPLAKQQAIAGLASRLRQEQRIAEQLLHNGERLMDAIASELLAGP